MKKLSAILIFGILYFSCDYHKKKTNEPSPSPSSTCALEVIGKSTSQDEDSKLLRKLSKELKDIAYSSPCNDQLTWSYIGYGHKACGGFKDYLPYNDGIDTTDFKCKVKHYTKQENVYNRKWSIVSDCSVKSPPSEIGCKDGLIFMAYTKSVFVD